MIKMKQSFRNLFREDNLFLHRTTQILLPPFLLTFSFGLSIIGPKSTFVFLFILLPIAFTFLHINVYQGSKTFTEFYVSWAVSSFTILISVFEFIVVSYLEITIWENWTLLSLITISVLIIIYIRHHANDTNTIIAINNNPNTNGSIQFYSLWISSYICSEHLKLYLLSQTSIVVALLFGIYLNITTVCHTNYEYHVVLIPDDCSDVYFDFNLSVSFVSALYSSLLATVLFWTLLKHLFNFSKRKSLKRDHYHPVCN